MERRYYKAINFDLDTRLLNQYHPTKDYHNAYYDMRKFFKHHGFYHKQGSGYVSQQKISSQDIYLLIDALYEEKSLEMYLARIYMKNRLTRIRHLICLILALRRAEYIWKAVITYSNVIPIS